MEAEARKRMMLGKKDPTMKSPQGSVRKQIARLAVSSEQTVERVKYIVGNVMDAETIICRIEEGESTIAKEYEAMRNAVATRDQNSDAGGRGATDQGEK
jgi:hypothetical protein